MWHSWVSLWRAESICERVRAGLRVVILLVAWSAVGSGLGVVLRSTLPGDAICTLTWCGSVLPSTVLGWRAREK